MARQLTIKEIFLNRKENEAIKDRIITESRTFLNMMKKIITNQ